jgi:hypothetical protein
MKTRTKVGKDGLLQFYTGRKKATDTEIKQFIKKNYEITPKEKLPKYYSQYLGRVKGGHNRQAKALRTEAGVFMTKEMQAQIVKQTGIDVVKLSEKRGFKTVDELLKNDLITKIQYDEAIGAGIEKSFNKTTAAAKVIEFEEKLGGKIFINGKQVTAKNAALRLNRTFNKLKRQFGNLEASVKFRYKGRKELRINLPTDGQIENSGDDISEFLFKDISERGDLETETDAQGNISTNYDWLNDWEIYGS